MSMTRSQSDMEKLARHIASQPDPRIRAAAEADDVREFSGLPRKHSPAYYANLRNGDLYRGDDAPTPGLTFWVLVLAAIGGVVLGAMAMPAMPAPHEGPGFEAACQKGC